MQKNKSILWFENLFLNFWRNFRKIQILIWNFDAKSLSLFLNFGRLRHWNFYVSLPYLSIGPKSICITIPNELNQQCKTRSNNNSITFPEPTTSNPPHPLPYLLIFGVYIYFSNRKFAKSRPRSGRNWGTRLSDILFAKSSHKQKRIPIPPSPSKAMFSFTLTSPAHFYMSF